MMIHDVAFGEQRGVRPGDTNNFMKLVIATNNQAKLEQFQHLLGRDFEVISLAQAGVNHTPDETGTTFRQNAFLKANAAHIRTELAVVADDSGLCVDALDGEPGVYSAIYGAPQSVTDYDRNNLLLKNMQGEPNRACHYVCCLCLILPYRPPIYFEEKFQGELLHEPQGTDGFGYDPIVYIPEMQCSNAELPIDVKLQISHRGLAMAKLKTFLSPANPA